ncbi:MAG TPA: CorA family divalent cation transporter [Actinomycetota bacterium]|jgi:magnesium transporter|nr:CorA family divalent cation transporter [Actinomycetota bacterium]
MLTAIHHTPDGGWQEVADLSIISKLCDQSGARVWAEADISTLTPHDIDTIAEEFGLHELAVEDATGAKERPKLEEYEKHMFVVVHELQMHDGQLEPAQIACFVGTRYVLALHAGAARTIDETKRRLRRHTGELWGGSAFLMHTLLDTIVDDYQRIADEVELEVEELEEELLQDPRSPAQTRLYTVKQREARFRRYVLPASRMLAMVVSEQGIGASIALVDTHFGAYFRDIHDHTLRIADQIRSVEDLSDALIDLVRIEATNAQNDVTKRLTGWAAIIAVPTYIASVYGMNYQLIPRHEELGFFFALGLMATSAVGLYTYFKRRGWI